MLGAGVVILIGTGGVGYAGYRGVHALRRGSRKKILKQEILDLSVRTNTEAQKYPDWFQQQSCRRAVNTANEMQHYTDEQLDEILDDSRERKDYDKTKYFIESAILEWAEDYNQITGRAIHMTDKYNKALVEINTLKSSFLKEGYILEEVDVPQFPISRNLTEVVSKAEHVVNILEYSIGKLKTVR